ncbi:hypothetical protein PCYB_003580, partial [Plasmodium cynomolgi strain B]
DSKLWEICGKLVKYLKTNYEKENKGPLKDHHCNLLSLWIYEKLFEHFKHDLKNAFIAYGDLMLILSNVFTDANKLEAYNCLHGITVRSYDHLKNSKDLYDYFVDYDEFNKLTDVSDGKCDKYEKYIKKKSPLYERFEELYIQAFKDEDNVFYEKCKYYNPENLVPKLKCEIEKLLAQQQKKEFLDDRRLSDHTEFSCNNTDSTKTFGYVSLGVAATSMISGLLYKVNKILIKTY